MKFEHDCRGCEKRTVGCHSSCEPYLKAKKKHEEDEKRLKKAKQSDSLYQEFIVKSHE